MSYVSVWRSEVDVSVCQSFLHFETKSVMNLELQVLLYWLSKLHRLSDYFELTALCWA